MTMSSAVQHRRVQRHCAADGMVTSQRDGVQLREWRSETPARLTSRCATAAGAQVDIRCRRLLLERETSAVSSVSCSHMLDESDEPVLSRELLRRRAADERSASCAALPLHGTLAGGCAAARCRSVQRLCIEQAPHLHAHSRDRLQLRSRAPARTWQRNKLSSAVRSLLGTTSRHAAMQKRGAPVSAGQPSVASELPAGTRGCRGSADNSPWLAKTSCRTSGRR